MTSCLRCSRTLRNDEGFSGVFGVIGVIPGESPPLVSHASPAEPLDAAAAASCSEQVGTQRLNNNNKERPPEGELITYNMAVLCALLSIYIYMTVSCLPTDQL